MRRFLSHRWEDQETDAISASCGMLATPVQSFLLAIAKALERSVSGGPGDTEQLFPSSAIAITHNLSFILHFSSCDSTRELALPHPLWRYAIRHQHIFQMYFTLTTRDRNTHSQKKIVVLLYGSVLACIISMNFTNPHHRHTQDSRSWIPGENRLNPKD